MSRAEWLQERSRIPGVGASESAALFGLHPQISAFSLFEKLVNPRPLTDEELEEETDVQSFGLAIEPYLAEWWGRKTKRVVTRPDVSVYRVSGRPYIFASPDREYLESPADTDKGTLELKSAIYFQEHEPLPDHWQVQVQQQMLCAILKKASFAILGGGFRRRYHVNDIPVNAAFGEILIETIERFMAAVEAGSWARWGGDLDGSKSTAEALKRLYPRDNGTVVQLPPEAREWAAELAQIETQAGESEARKTQLNNFLKAAIGEHSYGVLEDGSGYSLKITKGSTFTVTKADYRTLRKIAKLPRGLVQTVLKYEETQA